MSFFTELMAVYQAKKIAKEMRDEEIRNNLLMDDADEEDELDEQLSFEDDEVDWMPLAGRIIMGVVLIFLIACIDWPLTKLILSTIKDIVVFLWNLLFNLH